MKKAILAIVVLVIIGVGFWLASPLWRNKSLNDEAPSALTINDSFDSMTQSEKANFNEAVDSMKDSSTKMIDTMPESGVFKIKEANFVARAHEVEGKAKLIKTGDSYILRFEDFKTVNGPDLRIYLSNGLGAEDYVDLGAIRATEGNINYDVPVGTNVDKYTDVLVWCRAFSVLFSYAELQ